MTLRSEALTAEIRRIDGRRRLLVHAADAAALDPFEGSAQGFDGRSVLEGDLSPHNARALRDAFPHLTPTPVGPGISAGVGDRLGLAGPGQVDAFRTYGSGVFPVFAQQSIRELDRLGRTPVEVMDAATFGQIAAGWSLPVGADLDHIHRIDDIQRGVQAGYPTFTLDPGDHVHTVTGELTADDIDRVDWEAFGDSRDALVARYADTTLDFDGILISPSADDVLRAAVKYADAVVCAERMHRRVHELVSYPVEVEVAVDETDQQTTFFEHHFIAAELRRRDVSWVGFAPRYIDGFEKGVEFIGDIDALAADFRGHTAVARQHGGYKLSLHSGSDKFSIYDAVIEATEGRIHLKTSGTSYLTALGIVATREPALFREIYAESARAFTEARNSYQVSAVPQLDISAVPDAALPEIVATDGSRQVLHVGYGAVLTRTDTDGSRHLEVGVCDTLARNEDEYRAALHQHIGRHLIHFSRGSAR